MNAPKVSVVLPTYNRQPFLESAFAAIEAQKVPSLEVVVVDDGSTDGTREAIERLTAAAPFPVRYVHQVNRGAYGARNTGVRLAAGDYIAFYDSDDVWLPHHLGACVEALETNADVDWVYSSSEIRDLATGRVLDPDCFHTGGQPRPFLRLASERRGALHVITDPGAIRCQIDHGLYCGLQNSVLRRRVFERLSLEEALRNEAEDQVFAIRALAAGFRLAYFDAVHVRYHVHDGNSSAAATGMSLEKQTRVYETLVTGYERLRDEVALSATDRRALQRRIARELFWHIGYAAYWTAGERQRALQSYTRALKAWPWDPRLWKTYLVALMRTRFQGAGANATGGRG